MAAACAAISWRCVGPAPRRIATGPPRRPEGALLVERPFSSRRPGLDLGQTCRRRECGPVGRAREDPRGVQVATVVSSLTLLPVEPKAFAPGSPVPVALSTSTRRPGCAAPLSPCSMDPSVDHSRRGSAAPRETASTSSPSSPTSRDRPRSPHRRALATGAVPPSTAAPVAPRRPGRDVGLLSHIKRQLRPRWSEARTSPAWHHDGDGRCRSGWPPSP